jgi:hypothetical protein
MHAANYELEVIIRELAVFAISHNLSASIGNKRK